MNAFFNEIYEQAGEIKIAILWERNAPRNHKKLKFGQEYQVIQLLDPFFLEQH